MKQNRLGLVCLYFWLAFTTSDCRAAYGAGSVIDYFPGLLTGASAGYTNRNSILGEFSRITPGQFGGPVEPFNPPYLPDQLLSLGQGGAVTVRMENWVPNLLNSPFGLDLVVYGSSGFIITNGDFTGGGVTDGSMFGQIEGESRVSVSRDGQSFYVLDPTRAPSVDGQWPSDGIGHFGIALNPTFNNSSFNGQGITGIRSLYNGSAGGAGFDIGWAQNPDGSPANLDGVQFVRIEVLNGRADIDAIGAVPEPQVWTLMIFGCVLLVYSQRRLQSRAINLKTGVEL